MLPVQPATHDHLKVSSVYHIPLQHVPQILRVATRVVGDYIKKGQHNTYLIH